MKQAHDNALNLMLTLTLTQPILSCMAGNYCLVIYGLLFFVLTIKGGPFLLTF